MTNFARENRVYDIVICKNSLKQLGVPRKEIEKACNLIAMKTMPLRNRKTLQVLIPIVKNIDANMIPQICLHSNWSCTKTTIDYCLSQDNSVFEIILLSPWNILPRKYHEIFILYMKRKMPQEKNCEMQKAFSKLKQNFIRKRDSIICDVFDPRADIEMNKSIIDKFSTLGYLENILNFLDI